MLSKGKKRAELVRGREQQRKSASCETASEWSKRGEESVRLPPGLARFLPLGRLQLSPLHGAFFVAQTPAQRRTSLFTPQAFLGGGVLSKGEGSGPRKEPGPSQRAGAELLEFSRASCDAPWPRLLHLWMAGRREAGGGFENDS